MVEQDGSAEQLHWQMETVFKLSVLIIEITVVEKQKK